MAEGKDFKITLPITGWVTRSYTDEKGIENNVLVLEGIASDASKDQYDGQMSADCIVGMVDAVNNGVGVPVFNKVERAEKVSTPVSIDVDHSDHWTDQIGRAVEARAIYELTPEMKDAGYVAPLMYVKAEVDLDMSHGRDLQRALKKGTQLGMSVWGYVKDGRVEVNRATGERTERFNKVDLRKIAITSKPVNKNTWLAEVRRSMIGVPMENEETAPEAVEVVEEVVETAAQEIEPQGLAEALSVVESTEATPEAVSEEAPAEVTAPQVEAVEVAEGTEEVVARSEEQPEPAPEAPAVEAEGEKVVEVEAETPVEAVVDVVEAEVEAPVTEVPAEAPAAPIEVEPIGEQVKRAVSEEKSGIIADVLERVRKDWDPESISRSMSEHAEVIRSLPALFEAANNEIERAMKQSEELRSEIVALRDEVSRLKAQPMGRRGIVARSEAPNGELTPEQRSYIARKLAETDKVAAANFLLGRLLVSPESLPADVKIPQELLDSPDQTHVE